MTDANLNKLIAQFGKSISDQLSQSTSEETYTDVLPIDCHGPAFSYYDGLNRDSPYAALKNSEITDEQAIAIIRKASEFTTITPELEGIYNAKVGQGLSGKDACNAVLDELADFVRK
jgi:hypothetical protein